MVPGRDGTPDELRAIVLFGRTGDATTGPPSLRLIALHCSGNRAEKLPRIKTIKNGEQLEKNLQGHNDLDTEFPKDISRMFILVC